jgi:hypothetical protein
MDRRVPLALGIDVFSVTLFVAVGRREHERDSGIAGLIDTAAPFLIALAIAWLVLRARQPPDRLARRHRHLGDHARRRHAAAQPRVR